MEPALGVITMFAADFAPQGWALCNGQILSIAQNTALFSILGTTYGGNGQTTFGLPDMRGRSPMGIGQGSGLSNRNLGEVTGSATVTLLASNLPAHTHTGTTNVAATTSNANSDEADGMIFAGGGVSRYAQSNLANGSLGGTTVSLAPAGNTQPIDIRQPYIAVSFIIALQGIYPSRN